MLRHRRTGSVRCACAGFETCVGPSCDSWTLPEMVRVGRSEGTVIMGVDVRWPEYWPTVARGIAESVNAAVQAVQAESAPDALEAFGELADRPFEQVVAVQSGIVRDLLEMAHPDGLAGEDIQRVLERCVRSTVPWFPDLDVSALAEVLTGALGVADVDTGSQVSTPASCVRAAIVVIVDLLRIAKIPAVVAIRNSVGEVARAETVEMP